jgi:hypothetical protein
MQDIINLFISTIADIDQVKLTQILQMANLIKSNSKVVDFEWTELEKEKSQSGKVFLLKNIHFDRADQSNLIEKLVLKFAGSSLDRTNNETLFYSKVAYEDSLLAKVFAIFKLNAQNDQNLYLMEYVQNVHSFDINGYLTRPFIYVALRHLARFHVMNIGNDRVPVELAPMFDNNGQVWLTGCFKKFSEFLVSVFQPEFSKKVKDYII